MSTSSYNFYSQDLAVCARCKTTRPKKYLVETKMQVTVDGANVATVAALVCKDIEGLDIIDKMNDVRERVKGGPADMCHWQLYALGLDGKRALTVGQRGVIEARLNQITKRVMDKRIRKISR